MALLDVLGRRWALRILWELRGRSLSFRGIRDACGGASPTVVNQRVKELRDSRLIERTSDGYTLTPLGRELRDALGPLLSWSRRWERALRGRDAGTTRRSSNR